MVGGELPDTPGLLNDHTLTIHRVREGEAQLESDCGHAGKLPARQLEQVPVAVAVEQPDVSKCGHCFEDGGGY
jgi:hypothetical protein